VWKGNVRELQNVIEHVAVLAEPSQVIQPDDIPISDDGAASAGSDVPALSVPDEPFHQVKERVIAEFEKAYLRRLVGRAGGNMRRPRLANVDRPPCTG
jgi:DNA-binding NtrC family response regulator